MTEVSDERVNMYARHEIDFRRIALTLPQVEEFNPPPNFVKETDSRTKWYVDRFQTEDCWELDALSHKTVDQIIRAEVEPLIRSEERRVGKGCVGTCNYRWSRY